MSDRFKCVCVEKKKFVRITEEIVGILCGNKCENQTPLSLLSVTFS